MSTLIKIMQSKKTVFTIDDIQKLLHIKSNAYARLLLHRYKKAGVFSSPLAGIFVLSGYNSYQLATKMIPWSYVSCETVLQAAGIIFQDYSHTITLIADNTYEKKIDGTTFVYHKIKDSILYNPIGIQNYQNSYMMASPERAVCDSIYLHKNIFFDNLRPLDITKLEEIKDIYPQATILLINQLIKNVGLAKT